MATVVDFHTHIFENPLSKWIPQLDRFPFEGFRREARNWIQPISGSLHHLQTTLRYFPKVIRNNLDELGSLIPIPGLLLESTTQDLIDAMKETQTDYALIIAHPPMIPNELIIKAGSSHSQLIPIVNIPKNTLKPGQVLKSLVAQGARGLKIHPAADGEGPDCPRYRALLKSAADLDLPVILHTGCFHSHLFYKNFKQSQAEHFLKWFETYKDTKFILAHMNYHDPQTALDLCEEFENLFVDTSWQPAEIISEAARRIGAERVLFATDWPFIGNNLQVGRKRVQDCVDTGLLNESQAQLILGDNAVKILGLSINAN